MKSRTIISLILGICLLFACGVFVVVAVGVFYASKQQKTQAIVDVLNENNRNIREMQSAVNAQPDGLKRIHAMTTVIPLMIDNLRRIDTSKCPADFEQAYLRYKQSWELFAQKLSQFPQTDAQALSASLTGIISGNQLIKKSDEISMQGDRLHSTWNEVEAVALKYNVRIR